MTAAISAREVRKSYLETVALDGVSLEVEPGEVVALVGPNGAGKTTLVRCLTGTVRPDGGRVRLLGDEPAAVEEGRIGLLPQDFSPPGRLTARELLAYYSGLYDATRAVEDVIEQVGLGDVADIYYERLSGGERRRALVGSALVNDPEVLFLDEPTTGIDPAGRRTVWSLLETLVEAGSTVLLTTHSMAEAERLADRVGVLVNGDLAAIDTPEALITAHGGEHRLVVSCADPPRALSALEGIPARSDDGDVVIEGVAASRINEVVTALDRAGVDYERLTWSEPDLERVYLELTENASRLDVASYRKGGPQP